MREEAFNWGEGICVYLGRPFLVMYNPFREGEGLVWSLKVVAVICEWTTWTLQCFIKCLLLTVLYSYGYRPPFETNACTSKGCALNGALGLHFQVLRVGENAMNLPSAQHHPTSNTTLLHIFILSTGLHV